MKIPLFNPHVSIDCAVFGFDGTALNVLLIERNISEESGMYSDKKLPGSVILEYENLDDAASRVLYELTGIKNIYLSQFQSFGDPDRTSSVRDRLWLESITHRKIGRIVTVGYAALIKIDRKIISTSENTTARWHNINEINNLKLAFDHNEIVNGALSYIRHKLYVEPHLLFELLPRKFTISQLRVLYDVVHQTQSDVRNFQKKVNQMPYVVRLDEKEENVPHRAASLYKFDKTKISKL